MDSEHNPVPLVSVRRRRLGAHLIDIAAVFLLGIPAILLFVILGFLTFGLAWLALAVIYPAVAIAYHFFTLGSAGQATIGMRIMDIHLVRLDGNRVDPFFAVIHFLLYWLLSPAR